MLSENGTAAALREVEHQMMMARPWDAAEPESLWVITGASLDGKYSFTDCLAITLPVCVTGSDSPLFVFVGAMADDTKPVVPAWITHAKPLLIVHRDDPGTAYWMEDQVWIEEARHG